tara:strand:+ start:9799 stop:12288 length:2490 start_codon:yes stop_codon:yes gene_type:complete
MKNFNNSWRNFLNEGSRTENVPFEDTRIRIKLENDEKLLREVTDDEFEHIQKAIDELSYEQLAFHDIFGDKTRLIIDFPTADKQSELGEFIGLFKDLGYKMDWAAGTLSAERKIDDTSPNGMVSMLTQGGKRGGSTTKKINMKIGKWLKRLYGYLLKHEKIDNQILDYAREHVDPKIRRGAVTGKITDEALGGDERAIANYYRLGDAIGSLTYSEDGIRLNLDWSPGYVETLMHYWQNNADYIKKNVRNAYSNQYSIIITRDPVDVWRMSDFENISSCHSPPSRGGGGEYYKCAVAEAHGHGAVAYVVKTSELLENTASNSIEEAEEDIQKGEVFGDDARFGGAGFDIMPVQRGRLRQLRYYDTEAPKRWDDGVQIALPEKRTYGANIPGFYNRMLEWARETQKTQMESAPRVDGKLDLNQFIKFGGSHDDNSMSMLMLNLFNIGSLHDVVGRVKHDTDTEDQLDVNLMAGQLEQYQNECTELSEAWNNRLGHTTVEGTAVDDGADSVYIVCSAEMNVIWDADEWTKMPGIDLIGYALGELSEYGINWAKSDYPYMIKKRGDYNQHQQSMHWVLPIDIENTKLVQFRGQEFAYAPDDYEDYCSIIDDEVDDKYESVKQILTNFFKREGYMGGGAVMELGRKVLNDDTGLYHWESQAEEGYEIDEYEFIQFTAHPEVWYDDLNATEEQAMKIMNDRNFWLELRKRMAAPAFENTGGEMYPQMPLDMDMFGNDGTEGKSQELNLYLSVYGEDPDEQVKVLEELVNLWDDQEEIDRVANEVFRDMLAGSVNMDGTPVGDQRGQSPGELASVNESNKKEELNILRIERMLKRL